jgi:aminopeptidase N
MALYFKRCDGTAATIEDFIACFAETSGTSLDAFLVWYRQAGTPHVTIAEHYDPATREFRLGFSQMTPATPGQAKKEPVIIPIALGFLRQDGRDMHLATEHPNYREGVFVLDRENDKLAFRNVDSKPVLSALRGFSAPVILKTALTNEDRLVLLAHDRDPFNRWQAAQGYATHLLTDAAEAIRNGRNPAIDPRFADALASTLTGKDHALMAQLLTLPSESDIAREIGRDIDPDAIRDARLMLKQSIGRQIAPQIQHLVKTLQPSHPYQPDAASAGQRALKNTVLDLFAAGDPSAALPMVMDQYHGSDNMTDRFAALSILAQHKGETRETALTHFAESFKDDPLVLDKWFALQAGIAEDETLDRVKRLMNHPGFSKRNPNRLRALVGSFAAGNPSQFNRKDGAGYAFVADIVIETDRSNPQVAARILGAFKLWRSLEPQRRALAEAALRTIEAQEKLSPDVGDIVLRTLADS